MMQITNTLLLRWRIHNQPEILLDQRMLRSLVKDLFSSDKLFCNHLIMVIDSGILSEMQSAQSELDARFITAYATKLVKEYGINENNAKDAIDCWSRAIYKLPDCIEWKELEYSSSAPMPKEERVFFNTALQKDNAFSDMEKTIFSSWVNKGYLSELLLNQDDVRRFIKGCQRPFELFFYSHGKNGLLLVDNDDVRFGIEAISWTGELNVFLSIINKTDKQLNLEMYNYCHYPLTEWLEFSSISCEQDETCFYLDFDSDDEDGERYVISGKCEVSLCCSIPQTWYFDENVFSFNIGLWIKGTDSYDGDVLKKDELGFVYYSQIRKMGILLRNDGDIFSSAIWFNCDTGKITSPADFTGWQASDGRLSDGCEKDVDLREVKRRQLIDILVRMGYSEDLGEAIAANLRIEKPMNRMIEYLLSAKPRNEEEIVDEVYAITSDIDNWFTEKDAELFIQKINEALSDGRDGED